MVNDSKAAAISTNSSGRCSVASQSDIESPILLGPDVPFRPPNFAQRHRLKNGDLSCTLAVWDVR